MRNTIISIKYPLAIDRGVGTLAEELDYEKHVVQMIKQVLFTNPGERINRPDFGCGIRNMVFAPNNEVSVSLLKVTIYEALETWLSSVIRLEQVEVKAIDETLEVNIAYILLARQQRKTLTFDISV